MLSVSFFFETLTSGILYEHGRYVGLKKQVKDNYAKALPNVGNI